jgi:hypothetical protein
MVTNKESNEKAFQLHEIKSLAIKAEVKHV